MEFYILLLISIGLAMDAFAVSLTCGFHCIKHKKLNALKTGLLFGGFQAAMPVLGYYSGYYVNSYVNSFSHWIAFSVLCFIGVKMLYESFKPDICNNEKTDYSKIKILLILAFATSIDAFAVGLSFAFMNVGVIYPALIIGLVTFIMTIGGFIAGDSMEHYMGKWAERAGGLVLIGIGFKILLEHIL